MRTTARAAARPIPILQGQHPEYLVKQLTEFKAGKRNNPIMTRHRIRAERRRHEERRRLLRGKQAKPGFAKSKDTVALGEKIYRGGIADRQRPGLRRLPQPERRRHAGRSTRAWPASKPTTPRRSWWPSAAASARTACR